MSCSNKASRPSDVIVKLPELSGFARPNAPSLAAISAGTGGGSRFASAAPFSFRSQSISSAARFESTISYKATRPGGFTSTAASALVKDDVPHRYERVGFESLCGRFQGNYQALLALARALQEGVFVVQGLAREIHLRHQTVALARDIEMNMRGPHPAVGASRIRTRLDGLDPVAPLSIGGQDREALEIGIQRRWIVVTRVRVAPVGIGLPNLHAGALDRLPLGVDDPPHQMDHLSRCASRLARNRRQIRALMQRFDDGIKRPQDLIRCPPQHLSQRGADAGEHGPAARRNRHTQGASACNSIMSTHSSPSPGNVLRMTWTL